ncbi:MAG: metallophosphoesterase [Clostridia bacterium]|nr:metallophosphoesterase [Clostridia bacterium]
MDLHKLSSARFPAKDLTKDDFLLICGDCGVLWDGGGTDRYLKKWYDGKPWTTLFIDGNHENFDLLEQYPVSKWHGGNVHQITDSIIHLMRGELYTLGGYTFFTMGGASSHDREYRKEGRSWWAREMPSEAEFEKARKNLHAVGSRVDYIFTHCASSEIQAMLKPDREADALTRFFSEIEKMEFRAWFFGHYHVDRRIDEKHTALYEKVVRLF